MKNIFSVKLGKFVVIINDKLLSRSLLRYRLKGYSNYLFLQGLPGIPGLPGYSGRKGEAVSTFAFYLDFLQLFFSSE